MTQSEKSTLILTTCPDRTTGESIARLLVTEGSAACINLIDNIHSIYRWKDGIESEQETLLIIKTVKHRYREIEETIREMHPYEVPEIIALDIEQGEESYLQWISQSTTKA